MSRVLITGGSGFIGTNLVQRCIERGEEVLNVDIRPPQDVRHERQWNETNLLEESRLKEVFARFRPRYVFHLAARTDLNETRNLRGYAVNIDGVRNLVRAVRGCGSVERCVYTSSQLVCRVGHIPRTDTEYAPNTLYGESKVWTEKIVRELDGGGVDWCIVRPTTVWGSWCSPHYRRFFDLIRKGRYFHVGRRDLYKSYGYVGNFCHQVIALMESPSESMQRKILYLADYEPVSLRAWSEAFRQEFGAPRIATFPIFMAKTAASIGDLIVRAGWKDFPFTSFRLNNILTEYVFDLSEIRQFVPLLPYTMTEGVRETIRWLRSGEAAGSNV